MQGPTVWNGLPLALRLLPRSHFLTHSITTRKLLFLTAMESGAPLSSFPEEVPYKSLNE